MQQQQQQYQSGGNLLKIKNMNTDALLSDVIQS
jgi:hypothetical protein